MFSALLACGGSLLAAEPVEVHWNEFCRVAGNRLIEATKDSGEVVLGYCLVINADEVQLRTYSGIVKIGRRTLSHIVIDRSEGHQLATLGRGVRKGFKDGVNWLLSPQAMLGIVTIPAVAVWGAVSAPFCALGDLKYHLLGKEEIKLI